MFQYIDNDLDGIKLSNPDQTIINERNEDAFVDDTSLITDEEKGR